MPDVSAHRLPPTVIPSAYAVELEPDLDAATFTGTVRIEANVEFATSEIVLNAAELTVHRARLTIDTHDLEDAHIDYDREAERLVLTAPQVLAEGPVVIELAFDGVLNDKLRGFYRSTFVDDDGVTHTIATTQFESTNARRAFPCWDEPDLKATFEVALVVPTDLLAVSSGPEIARDDLGNGRVRVQFGPTMAMSTYLLAFVVGPLEATDAIDVGGVPLRVVHQPGKGHLTGFALDAGAFSLAHFTSYFGIPYPGEKLDLVALPDFAFGAMENLGCVTFRQALLLLDPAESTQPEQQRAADVIAHEIAHMWFGDLVTMRWWNGIWLKEAFATFCEMHATNAMRPDWRRWEDFGLARTAAFNVDSLESTRPIEFDVVSPADAEAMYDTLTYEKGAAVVRMLEQYLGEEPFRDGIRHYLDVHAYGNTETHDLWNAIEETTGQPARAIMDSWIFQGGYPLVTAERVHGTTIRLHQQRFGYEPIPADTMWSVPVVLAYGSGGKRHRRPVLLDAATLDVDLGPGPVDWVYANADASGFYRVQHASELHTAVVGALDTLTSVERYGLIDDAWASIVADKMAVADLLELVRAVAAMEHDTAVWRRVTAVLRGIDTHLGDDRSAHRAFALELVDSALDRVGVLPAPGEPEQTTELRATLFETGGVLGGPSHVAAARELVEAPADPARTAAAINIVATTGGADDFRLFADRYRNAPNPQEERRYLFALPLFRGPDQADRLFTMLDDGSIRSQDGAYVLGRALANDATAAMTWAYIEANWEALGARYPDNSIPRMLAGAQSVGDPDVAAAIDAFFETHDVPQAGKTLDQHLERMRVTVRLRERLRAQLR